MSPATVKQSSAHVLLSSAQSVAAALPHLIGFHPHESLVCMWLRDRTILVVQRADLPQSASGERADCVTAEAIDEYVDAYLHAAAEIPADEVVVVCVTRRIGTGRTVVRSTTGRLAVPVRGALLVNGGRVQEVDRQRGWTWISAEDRQRASVELECTRDGANVARSRADVVAEVECSDPQTRDGADFDRGASDGMVDAAALVAVLERGDWTAARTRSVLRDAGLTVTGRDVIMWWCARSTTRTRRALLQALLAGLRTTHRGPHLASAAAACAWMCGDGVRANAALDRCLREDPHHTLGRLLESAMAAAVSPSTVAHMLGGVDPSVVGLDEGFTNGDCGRGVVDEPCGGGYSPA